MSGPVDIKRDPTIQELTDDLREERNRMREEETSLYDQRKQEAENQDRDIRRRVGNISRADMIREDIVEATGDVEEDAPESSENGSSEPSKSLGDPPTLYRSQIELEGEISTILNEQEQERAEHAEELKELERIHDEQLKDRARELAATDRALEDVQTQLKEAQQRAVTAEQHELRMRRENESLGKALNHLRNRIQQAAEAQAHAEAHRDGIEHQHDG